MRMNSPPVSATMTPTAKASTEIPTKPLAMLSMAYLGRMLTNWQPQAKLRKFGNKFAAITHLQDAITCNGKVVELLERDGETLARCEIQAVKQNGEQTLVGEALVAL